MEEIYLKGDSEIKIMAEGGKKLARIKNKLRRATKEGVKASEIESLAQDLIQKEGAVPSFAMVPGYSWATCINVNSGLVHGIPKESIVFKKGDVVSVDVGIYYKGFHTDTSFTVGIGVTPEVRKFLDCGQLALRRAIAKVKAGARIFDISEAIEDTVKAQGYRPIKALVGHGVGKSLHEGPQIPCFTAGKKEKSPIIVPGMVLAIEVMYAQGSPEVEIGSDGWTISMRDDKISALYEETVAINRHGPFVLTE